MPDMQKSIESLHEKVDAITEKIENVPYRIKILERIVFGAVKLILVAFVISVIFLVIPKGGNKVIAKNIPTKNLVNR